MKQGWISVHRQIQDHWLWADKPFSKGQAWIDMLLMANHEDKKVLFGSELVDIKAGGLITSEVKLSERWGWSRHKVRDFLDVLQKDRMADIKRTPKGITIFVINYAKYRYRPDAEGQLKDIKRTSKGHQKDTNNNVNNDNKYNNTLSYERKRGKKKSESVPSFDLVELEERMKTSDDVV